VPLIRALPEYQRRFDDLLCAVLGSGLGSGVGS